MILDLVVRPVAVGTASTSYKRGNRDPRDWQRVSWLLAFGFRPPLY